MTVLLVALGIGTLTACGVFMLLRARSFEVVLGLTLLSHAVNLFIFGMGRLAANAAPIVRAGRPADLSHYTDPLPQALVLTAIVISFGMTALLGVLAFAARDAGGTDHVDGLPGAPDTESVGNGIRAGGTGPGRGAGEGRREGAGA